MTMLCRISALSLAVACASTVTDATAFHTKQQVPLPKLPYQECVDIGTSISVKESAIQDLKRRIPEERVAARVQALQDQMNRLADDVDSLKLKQNGCVGVTIDAPPQRTASTPRPQNSIGGAVTVDIAPSTGPKLPYQDCVNLGSSISIKEGEIDNLKALESRSSGRAADIQTRVGALAREIAALKKQEQAGCKGVTLSADGKADTETASSTPTGGAGSGGINPLCQERVDVLTSIRNDTGDTSLPAIRKKIAEVQDEIRIRERLLAGDVSSEDRANVQQRVKAAKSVLAAKQSEEAAITGRIDRLRQELESLGCDPETGKATGAPPRAGRGTSGRGSTGAGSASSGAATTPVGGVRDTRFTGTFELWIKYSVRQPEVQLGTLVLRDIYQDRGREQATTKLGERALVDLRNCGRGTDGARTVNLNHEYYEGEIHWMSNSFLDQLNQRPPKKTPMENARVTACSSMPERIDVLFSGTEGRGGEFQLIRRSGFLESTINFDLGRSATLNVRVR